MKKTNSLLITDMFMGNTEYKGEGIKSMYTEVKAGCPAGDFTLFMMQRFTVKNKITWIKTALCGFGSRNQNQHYWVLDHVFKIM